MTRTYAVMEVPQAVYDVIKAKLLAAGYDHVFDNHGKAEVIDMHGIALRALPVSEPKPDTGEQG